MKLFGQIIRTAVNVALLPVDIAKDVVTAPLDVMLASDQGVGERTMARIQKLKDEASE